MAMQEKGRSYGWRDTRGWAKRKWCSECPLLPPPPEYARGNEILCKQKRVNTCIFILKGRGLYNAPSCGLTAIWLKAVNWIGIQETIKSNIFFKTSQAKQAVEVLTQNKRRGGPRNLAFKHIITHGIPEKWKYAISSHFLYENNNPKHEIIVICLNIECLHSHAEGKCEKRKIHIFFLFFLGHQSVFFSCKNKEK